VERHQNEDEEEEEEEEQGAGRAAPTRMSDSGERRSRRSSRASSPGRAASDAPAPAAAATEGLEVLVGELEAENAAFRRRNATLSARVRQLEARLVGIQRLANCDD
jgi:hypothetical protein